MSATRPAFIDLRSPSFSSRGPRSPRLHVPGEQTPALSPLDAFQRHTELLARQLEESNKDGKRMSRLPPLTAESPLVVQGRSDYFRSAASEYPFSTADAADSHDLDDDHYEDDDEDVDNHDPQLHSSPKRQLQHGIASALPPVTSLADMQARHRSIHTKLTTMSNSSSAASISPSTPVDQAEIQQLRVLPEGAYFTGESRATASPEPMESKQDQARLETLIERTGSRAGGRRQPLLRTATGETVVSSALSSRENSLGLTYARTPQQESFDAPHTPQHVASRSLGLGQTSTHFQSLPSRKASAASMGAGVAQSPPTRRHRSSSSDNSEMSLSIPRAFNFSRPMSRGGVAGPPTLLRQDTSGSIPQVDVVSTPASNTTDVFCGPTSPAKQASADNSSGAAPSYIYSKYMLPRAKILQMGSPQASVNPPIPNTLVTAATTTAATSDTVVTVGQVPSSPTSRPTSRGLSPTSPPSRSEHGACFPKLANLSKSAMAPLMSPLSAALPTTMTHNYQSDRRPTDPCIRPNTSSGHAVAIVNNHSTPNLSATGDGLTPLATPSKNSLAISNSTDMTTEDHLQKAIDLHEHGSLNESTYHLRHAARGGSPTGMLLYALACRHGWGMRPNAREGVQWLRKAAECASVEIADDESQIKEGKKVNTLERKTRKAQFALSIYELGVSHMNGWGIEQDKSLALRCFEIAGSWGDVDALVEAGYCYSQGIGCKRNLKKSAKFYRQAEAKGAALVGNSWIHKAKYDDEAEAVVSTPTARSGGDKQAKDGADVTRPKQRARSKSLKLFGKKS